MEEKEKELVENLIFDVKSDLNQIEKYNLSNFELISHSDNIENGDFKNNNKKYSKIKNDDFKILYSDKIRCKRILIEYSLNILIISFISLLFYFFILQRRFIDLQLILQTKTINFHCNFLLFYTIWILSGSKYSNPL